MKKQESPGFSRGEQVNIGPSWTDVPELRDYAHAFAVAMGVSTSEAMLMLTQTLEAFAPLVTIHPDTIRRMHAAALNRREDRP